MGLLFIIIIHYVYIMSNAVGPLPLMQQAAAVTVLVNVMTWTLPFGNVKVCKTIMFTQTISCFASAYFFVTMVCAVL